MGGKPRKVGDWTDRNGDFKPREMVVYSIDMVLMNTNKSKLFYYFDVKWSVQGFDPSLQFMILIYLYNTYRNIIRCFINQAYDF